MNAEKRDLAKGSSSLTFLRISVTLRSKEVID